MTNVGPLAQGGLDEAFGLAVGAGSVGTGKAVLDAELKAGGAELAGAIAGAVVGEQAADGDAVLGVEGDGGGQEGEGEQIAGSGMLVAHDGWGGMQVAPAVEMSTLQNAADGGGAEAGGLGDLIGGAQLAPQGNDLGYQL